MTSLLERVGGYFPAVVALALPVTFLPVATDLYILPRVAIVVAGACLGTGLALLIPNRSGLGALRLPLVAAAGAAVLAFIFSTNWSLSLAGSYTRYESLPVRLGYLGLLAATVWLLRTQRQRDLLIAGFVAGTTIACLKAWLEWLTHAPFRPDGDLGNANLLAALIAMAVPLAVDRARRAGAFAFAWGASIVVLALGLYLTTSRSGLAGAGAGFLALLAFSVPRRWSAVVAALASAVIVVGLVLLLASPLRSLNNDPPELRLHLWSDGLRAVATRPITGFGEDTTGLNFGQFLSQNYAAGVTFDRIHSGPLDVAATEGILGLAALSWVLIVLFRGAWQRRLEPNVAPLAGALVGYTVWVIPNFDWAPATGAFWLLAGALWSAAGQAAGPPAASPPRKWGGVVALVLVAAAVVLAAFPVLADVWFRQGRPDLSIKVDPLQAQYHWSLGTVAELRRAAELGETEPGMYVQLGDLERNAGDKEAARRDYLRALAIDPYYAAAHDSLAALSP